MRAFVIHNKECVDRKEFVDQMVKRLGAVVVEAVYLPDRVKGCFLSHYLVAQLSKSLFPDEPYFVLEDDCVLSDDFQEYFKRVSVDSSDIVYLGYTDEDKTKEVIYGTHAMILNPHARDIFLTYGKEPWMAGAALDHALSQLSLDHDLKVSKPSYELRERWCWQKRGLKSTITGGIRE